MSLRYNQSIPSATTQLTAGLIQAGHETAVVVECGDDEGVEFPVNLQNGLDVNFGVVQSILKNKNYVKQRLEKK